MLQAAAVCVNTQHFSAVFFPSHFHRHGRRDLVMESCDPGLTFSRLAAGANHSSVAKMT